MASLAQGRPDALAPGFNATMRTDHAEITPMGAFVRRQ
jgi:hypothetical protein